MKCKLLAAGLIALWLYSTVYLAHHKSPFDPAYSPFATAMFVSSGPIWALVLLLWAFQSKTKGSTK